MGSAHGDPILLCDDHFRQVSELQKGNEAPKGNDVQPISEFQQANDFQQVNAAVAGKEPNLGEGEFYRSETSRKRRFRLFKR